MKFRIQHGIDTIAKMHDKEGYDLDGLTVKPWWDGRPWFSEQRGLVASSVVEAAGVQDALNEFLERLSRTVSKLAFVSQCHARIDCMPFLISVASPEKRTEFFLHYAAEVPGVPLQFGPQELEAFRALNSYEEKGNFFYIMREAINTTTHEGRFALLAAAVEALTDEIEKGKQKRTNRDYIRENILGEELEKELLNSQTGLRNKFIHGRKLKTQSLHRVATSIPDIYQKIVEYFRTMYDIHLDENVVDPMRTRTGNYELWQSWMRPKDSSNEVNLETLYPLVLEEFQPTTDQKSWEFLARYEPIEMPKDLIGRTDEADQNGAER